MIWNCIYEIWNWIVIAWGWIRENGSALSLSAIIVSTTFAYWQLRTQRDLARKRAAVDFFLKTEIDQHSLLMWTGFKSALDALANSQSYEAFQKDHSKENLQIEQYLNIFELVACGIRGKILDEVICKAFWKSIILDAYDKTNGIIENDKEGFEQFKWLAMRWKRQK
jgi:hypothetical protein